MINVVEKLLSERFEGKVRLDAAEEVRSGGRSKVSRYRVLEGPQCAPQSVIVKQAVAVGTEVYDSDLPYGPAWRLRSEEHTSELQSLRHLVCRLLLEKKNKQY